MAPQLGILAAFSAGLLSFLSPCVLPLVPGYLSFMTGLSVSDLAEERPTVTGVLWPALLFVAGLSFVFVAMGASASVVGTALAQYHAVVGRVAGLVVIAFGVLMLGLVRVPWLYGEARADMSRARAFGRGTSFVMGMAFGAGWTPCVGPILGSILALAAASGTVGTGAFLLAVYSLGLGIPFIAVALLFGRLVGVMRWLNAHSVGINRAAGLVLVVLGALIFSGRLGLVSVWLTRVL